MSSRTHERHVNCPASLGARLASEFDNKDFSDVKLIVGENQFYAHRMLLANQSEMFRIMFNGSQWLESTQEEITLNETKECEKVFKDFLYFFYSAKIHLTTDNIVAVRILADKYQHIQLLKECDRFIAGIITHDQIDTILTWLVSMASLGDKLEQRCLTKLQLDFTRLMNSETSRNLLNLDILMKIVDSCKILVCNELVLFNMVAKWIMERRHPSSQKSAITKLLPLMRFQHMTTEHLGIVEETPLYTKYADLIMKYMFEAYKNRAQLSSTKRKDDSEEKDEAVVAKVNKLKSSQPMPRRYTDPPWGNGYVRASDVFLTKEQDIGTFTCPIVDRAMNPYCVTKSTESWNVQYKREIKTYVESEDQVINRMLVTHELCLKYQICKEPRSYEILILTGYEPIDMSDQSESMFTTLTTKKHYGTVKPIGIKTTSRRKIKFTEILKPALLGGTNYVFSVTISYLE